ncbi:MAG: PAS domain S-box protein, partial [Holophagaceae bacterium]
MPQSPRQRRDGRALRQRAEASVQAEVSSEEEVRDPASLPENLSLHELQVHQVELEMQNEELRRSYAELAALQERYRNLYDLAPVGYCTLSVQGIVLEANLTAATLLGVPRAALVGRHFSSFVPSDDQDMYFLKRQLIVQSGEPLDWEQRLRRKDGTVIWVSIKTTGLGIDQDWSQYHLVFSDITEGKRAEDTIRTIYAAMAQSPVSIVITDLSGAIEYVNPKFTEMTGYTAEEALGQNPRILKSGEAPPGHYWALWDTILGGGTWHGEFHNRRKGGDLFWEQATISPIKDNRGRITQFVAIKEDITERKRWEETLRTSEAKWRTLFEFLPVGISLLDDQRRVAEFNPALGHILRLAPDRLQGASYLDRTYLQADGTPLPAEELPSVRAMKEGGTIPPTEIGIQIEDGSLIWTEVAAAPLAVPGYSCVITTTDITQRKQTQEGLRRSEEALAKAQRFARVGSWTWHIKTNRLEWSDEMYRLFGIARETFS